MTDLTVALLGTGVMGAPMARHLAHAGFAVRAWNRTLERATPLGAHGVTVCPSPADAADGADVLVTALFDADAVASVADQALPHLADGAAWLQTSTVGIDGCRRLGNLADTHGVAFVDVPLLGTRGPAEQGRLVALASGPEAQRERAERLLDTFTSTVHWVGPAGAGSRLKLVVNSWILALTEGLAEAMALAEGLGLDPALFLDAISGAAVDSPYAHVKGRLMLGREFPVSFALDGAVKDAGLVLDAAHEAGVDMAVTRAVSAHLSAASKAGHGDKDMAATYLIHRTSDT